MRSSFFIPALLLFLFTGCDVRRTDKIEGNNGLSLQTEIKDPASVQIIDSSYDFGKVTDGDIVEFNYRFKNTGTTALIITNASASCGCTVPEKPEQPIQPGDTGFIKVKFNSEHRVGKAHKTVTVLSNAIPPFPELQLTGEVLAGKKD